MKLEDLMRNRRSTRQYKPTPIPLEKLQKILEAAHYAPSGANQQPWLYILITDPTLKQKIRKEAEQIEKPITKNFQTHLNSKLGLKNTTLPTKNPSSLKPPL
ncbi:MAG: nitroreductase family protein [Thermoproteota archaeon]|nr:nitroreductase family protein [Thermoproteota archaeon]